MQILFWLMQNITEKCVSNISNHCQQSMEMTFAKAVNVKMCFLFDPFFVTVHVLSRARVCGTLIVYLNHVRNLFLLI